MASILTVRDKDGNIIDIPAIKGDKGDPYKLTETDKTAIKEAIISETKNVFYCDGFGTSSLYDATFDIDKIYPQNTQVNYGDYVISDGVVYVVKIVSPSHLECNKLVDISPDLSEYAKKTDITMPTVTETDNGKFLRVVNGAWSAVTVENAEGVGF